MKRYLRAFFLGQAGNVDRVLAILALVFGGGAALSIVYDYIVTPHGVPVIMQRAEAINSPIRPGQDLKVRVWREKTRDDCPVSSERIVVHRKTGAVMSLRAETTAGGPVGSAYVDVAYPMPASMMRGEYELRTALAYHCPEQVYLLTQPPVTFLVE